MAERRTIELNVLELVRRFCTKCDQVIIPAGAQDELDLYRCRVGGDKHCLVAITTPQCLQKPLTRPD